MASYAVIAGRVLIGLMGHIVRAVVIRFPMTMNRILNHSVRCAPQVKTNWIIFVPHADMMICRVR